MFNPSSTDRCEMCHQHAVATLTRRLRAEYHRSRLCADHCGSELENASEPTAPTVSALAEYASQGKWLRYIVDFISHWDNVPAAQIVLRDAHAVGPDLPIDTGPFEAHHLSHLLTRIEEPRPVTHDLLVQVIRKMGAAIKGVFVSRFDRESRTIYATIQLAVSGKILELDARPSDAISAAVACNVNIDVAPTMVRDLYLSSLEAIKIQTDDPKLKAIARVQEAACEAYRTVTDYAQLGPRPYDLCESLLTWTIFAIAARGGAVWQFDQRRSRRLHTLADVLDPDPREWLTRGRCQARLRAIARHMPRMVAPGGSLADESHHDCGMHVFYGYLYLQNTLYVFEILQRRSVGLQTARRMSLWLELVCRSTQVLYGYAPRARGATS